MRVELLRTLKAGEIWGRGMVFDDAISPIPSDVMLEVSQGARTVRVFPVTPKAIKVSDITPVIAESFEVAEDVVEDQPDVQFPPKDIPEYYLVDPSSAIMESEPEEDSEEIVPEEEAPPEAATEKNVAAETDNASFITNEKPTEHLPELEGLIHAKGTIAAVARLLGVNYQTILRWRKGGVPKPEKFIKIKKEYRNLMRLKNDQRRIDDTSSTGTERSNE